jgi:hypothetical protein
VTDADGRATREGSIVEEADTRATNDASKGDNDADGSATRDGLCEEDDDDNDNDDGAAVAVADRAGGDLSLDVDDGLV